MSKEFISNERQKELGETLNTDLLKERNERLITALSEIKAITQGLTEFNPTYERIYKIATKNLEVL